MIDKIIPKKFVYDKDARLLQSGDMVAAQNLSFSSNSDYVAGSESATGDYGVVKPMRGTTPITMDSTQVDLQGEVTVIGSVSNESRGCIYFFCAAAGSGEDDMIIKYTYATDTYKRIVSNSLFNFSTGLNYPVKADIINNDFDGDGSIETIIYFTDGLNPPRKINADRAEEGFYDGLTDNEFEMAINAMPASSTYPPTFSFDTDDDYKENNFQDKRR